MGLLLFYPTPVFEKEDAMPEDFNQKLEKWIIDYCNSISKLLNFPIDIKKIKELLKYNANKQYITSIKKGLFDKDAHRTSYIES